MTTAQINPSTGRQFMFAACLRSGLDLVVTPWSYARACDLAFDADGWPMHPKGEPVTLVGAFKDVPGWNSFANYGTTLEQVCATVGHEAGGYTLVASESGRSWSLEVGSGVALWCTA